jgi:hypothetical protein
MHLQGAAHPAARTPRSGTVTGVVSNRPAGASNQFHAISTPHARQSHGGTPHRGQIQPSRTLCRRIRLRVTETAEPGKTRLNAEYGISPACEECARSDGAPKWPRRNLNLPLAAGPRVRHIRAHGAVAEWLKAAVC